MLHFDASGFGVCSTKTRVYVMKSLCVFPLVCLMFVGVVNAQTVQDYEDSKNDAIEEKERSNEEKSRCTAARLQYQSDFATAECSVGAIVNPLVRLSAQLLLSDIAGSVSNNDSEEELIPFITDAAEEAFDDAEDEFADRYFSAAITLMDLACTDFTRGGNLWGFYADSWETAAWWCRETNAFAEWWHTSGLD